MNDGIEYQIEDLISVQERIATAKKVRSVSSWLKKRHAWIGIDVLDRAKLYITSDIDRAAVSVSDSKVFLLFNHDFVKDIKLIELAATIVHEAMHVILKHQKRINSFTNAFDRRLFSFACEAVVNDIIKTYYYLPLPKDHITGHELIGKDCSKFSADQVFQMMKEDLPSINPETLQIDCLDDHDTWCDKASVFAQPCEDITDPEEHNQQVNEEEGEDDTTTITSSWSSETETDVIDEILQNKDTKRDSYGKSPVGKRLFIKSLKKTNVSLIPFCSKIINASKKTTTCWTSPNKKLISVYPKVILPTYPEDTQLNILFGLDASGSITEQNLEEFFAIASKPIPNTEKKMISFDTKWYEIDPNKREVKGGGGTDANIVKDYIETTYKRKPPDLCFILTDGYFPEFKTPDPSAFVFIITKSGTCEFIPKKSKRLLL